MNFSLFNGNAPIGFGMALAQNMQAMERFSQLPPEKRQEILEKTHTIQSKDEMRDFTDSLALGNVVL